MSNQFSTITVLDLEASCWEDKDHQERYSEIIEIGVCVINTKERRIENKRSIYVLPKLLEVEQLIAEQKLNIKAMVDSRALQYPAISEYCTELTGITKSTLLKRGKPLVEAIGELIKYYPVAKTWMSWGDYDLTFLKKECKKINIFLNKKCFLK